MQKIPLSMNNLIQYNRYRYIKNLTCTQVSSEALSHAVNKRATDINPQQRHLQTTNNVNEKDYRGFSPGKVH